MFTGLVQGIGEIRQVRDRAGVRSFRIRSPFAGGDLHRGESVAVHGVCLTLTEDGMPDGTFLVDAARETLRRTTLARLRGGDRVHLERALAAGDRLGGHLVQGHVDGVGLLRRSTRVRGEWILSVLHPRRLAPYIVEKGSIAIDGVSLTVGLVRSAGFRVHIIPTTANETLLARYRPGRRVNLEVDVIAKYVESQLMSRTVASMRDAVAPGTGEREEHS
jgi:riboflavin synthase